MTDEIDSVQVIEPDNFYGNEQHTTVFFNNGAFACSCGETSESRSGQSGNFFYKRIPSLRPENCTICGKSAYCSVHADVPLCSDCEHDFDVWLEYNQSVPIVDFLRGKLDDRT